MSSPKLFISRYGSDPDYEDLVLRTATDLRESGVEVGLDLWDLPGGADAGEMLKKAVADPETKVLILSGRSYAAKADQGGEAGSTLISRELYESRPPEEFALALAENDENEKAFIPSFYRSNAAAIDLSAPENYPGGFEKLIRWIYGKPPYIKPPTGEKPTYLDQTTGVSLGTRYAYKKAVEAVKDHRSTTEGRIDEYLNTFAENLERFRITDPEADIDQSVYDHVCDFRPFRDEYIRFLFAVAGYRPAIDFTGRIHRFFETLISYTRPPDPLNRLSDSDLDNFMFIVHELFLYTIAIFLKYELFEEVAHLLSEKYYVSGRAEYGQEELITFDTFHQHIESLEQLNQRRDMGFEAIRAEMLKERSAGTGLDFRYLMQADFTIFLRAELDSQPYYSQWWPETLMFLGHFRGAFEIYLRARSRIYFERMKIVLGIENPIDLYKLINSYEEEMRQLPRGLRPLSSTRLIGFEALATTS
ncbi:MAG: toll/interleukin-1 receptor domain-containing protein [Pyrinomonadaceae bacterium]